MASNSLTVALVALVASVSLSCRGDVGTAPLEASFALAVRGGNGQSAPAGSVLREPLSVQVNDAAGVSVKGARVVFRVQRGASSGSRMLDSVGVTGADGVATGQLQLGSALDTTLVAAFPSPAFKRAVTFRATAVAAPAITAVSPGVFGPGDTVTLRGNGLAGTLSAGGVEFGDARAAILAGGSDIALRAVVPPCLAAGATPVRVAIGTVRSNSLTALYQPRALPLTLAPFQAVTVDGARLTDCLVLPGDGASYLVVAQFAATGPADTPVDWRLGARVPTGTVADAARALRTRDVLGAQREFDAFLRRTEQGIAAQARAEAAATPRGVALLQGANTTPPALGSARSFRVVAAVDGSSFVNVTARLRFVGAHVLLYVDTVGSGFTDAKYRTLGTLFDRDLYPIDAAAFGSESDVDNDGRVLVVFTPRVNALARAQDCVQRGFVTGFFYGTDVLVSGANSNKAEIFYSFIPDSAGKFSCAHSDTEVLRILPGTFLHELQHMISFNQHVLARSGATEEIWLNEGLSHIAEELGSKLYEARFPPPSGRSTTEQIFPDSAGPFIAPQLLNAYVYLNATRVHSVTSYIGAGSVEERGATWLFLRWLGAQKGEDVFRQLVQTSKTGIPNVEAQAREPFGALFGDFSVALFADSLPGLPRASVPPRFQFGTRQLRKLMAREAVISGFSNPFPLPLFLLGAGTSLQSSMLPGTMTHTLVPTTAGGPVVALRFSRQDLSALPASVAPQVTIFRLPP